VLIGMISKNRFSLIAMLIALVVAFSNCGCGGGGTSSSLLPSVRVSVSAGTLTVQSGATTHITANVSNDSANKGVTWSVSCPVPQCGSVLPTSTPSGTPTTYTAPSTTRPNGLTVNITATAAINGASTDATITVPGPSLMVIPTYDGSGQATEPKVLFFPVSWHGFSYWMAMTPYTNSDASKENPSILASSDGQNWVVPPGVVNPVAPQAGAHLDDPELFYNASSDELWLYYLEEDLAGNTLLLLRTSSDGILWSSPIQLSSNKDYQMLSPTVGFRGNQYLLWGINSGSAGCSAQSTEVFLEESSDGKTWGPSQTLQISQPGFVIWHISVIWVQAKQEFWTVFAAYPAGDTCGNTSLFFARSPDGINWTTYSKPVFVPGNGWDSQAIYRSTLVYHPDTDLLQVWFSAEGNNKVWSIGFSELTYSDFVNLLQ
jgi:hypothetical protein